MNQKSNTNPSIACTVSNCTHHAKDQSYCTLNTIHVGCCGKEGTNCASTECDSFKACCDSGSC